MDGFEDAVALGIGDGAFALGVTSPQHVNDALLALCDGPHDRIGESFPAVSCVGGRFVRPDRQHGIEQQHALFGPAVEVEPVSSATSWKMFCSEGGNGTPSATEKQSPLACPSP